MLRKIKYIAGITLLLVFSNAHAAAGYIVSGSTITSVANVIGTEDDYVITVTGGTINMCGSERITFKRKNVHNDAVLARGYSAALTALASGLKVQIWSKDGTCSGANHIQVIR